ncbi:androgen-dependent TFPI-regulating protein-like [Hetaerina americana]|uniref:androgen-dependent TFPI-regulating protein-like n=1 Tax=Hetaerina americana TaxID=62018 RepID=UPI003A7F3918
MIAKVFHAVSLSIYLFLGYYFQKHLKVPDGVQLTVPDPAKEPWQYLTIWNVVFQEVYFVLCVVEDALEFTQPKAFRDLKTLIKKMRMYFFESVFFPTGLTVFLLFWPMFLTNRAIIYPVDLDYVVPLWMNHLIHTNILVLIALEVILCPHYYSARSEAFLRMCVVPACYILCLLTTNIVRGTWPYPLLGMIGHLGRFLFFAFSFCVVWLSTLAGERINAKLWGERSKSKMAQQSSHESTKIR